MSLLPLDYSRCLNDTCPLKYNCLRWIDKEDAYVFSMFKPESDTACSSQIKSKKDGD